ncbi:MAG TPA: DUF2071 domain-containing protein, partial [Thermomicrobiales bacterium]|nr:DUF2071 domain-containing protein [Thermomicrobiales bacterium]
DSLDRWLTERYCLYTFDRKGQVSRQEIDHVVWPLQPAEAEIERNTMTQPLGLDLGHSEPLLHFSTRLDVVVGPAELVADQGSGDSRVASNPDPRGQAARGWEKFRRGPT